MSWALNVATFLADPTGSLLATKLIAEEVAEKAKAGLPGEGGAAKPQAAPTPSDTNALVPCCNEYQFRDGFLVNTRTGAVWRYDQAKDRLTYVERVDSEIQKAAWGVLGAQLIEQLHKEKSAAALTAHHSVADEYDKHLETMIKVIRARAEGKLPHVA